MIRARNAPRPDSAAWCADLLTPTERAADRQPRSFVPCETLIYRDAPMRWGDVPHIRELLQSLRTKP